MSTSAIVTTFRVPEAISVRLESRTLTFQYNDLTNSLWINPLLEVSLEDHMVTFRDVFDTRRSHALRNTYQSLLTNITVGLVTPYSWDLRVLAKHFPIRLSERQGNLIIANFFGRKQDIAVPLRGIKFVQNKDVMTITHHDLQTLGNFYVLLRQRTKTSRDRRVFWDGFYILQKYISS